ncbi:hypothetical protein EVG20_g4777 [Dentipellis fragilis]|uniref:Uncharacterized protein n=1 Tax=Dentipellis fragilis TaxID=205917 RepID=A0A4Y9YXF2_9AGAM|nr:hypothetical protein EVG20_g4777 [Dentipellis fragilis]
MRAKSSTPAAARHTTWNGDRGCFVEIHLWETGGRSVSTSTRTGTGTGTAPNARADADADADADTEANWEEGRKWKDTYDVVVVLDLDRIVR